MSYNLFSFLCLYRKEETMEEYKKKYEEWLNNPCFDEETKKELESIKDNEKENMIKFLDGLNSLKDIIPEIKYMETGININPKNEYDAKTFLPVLRLFENCGQRATARPGDDPGGYPYHFCLDRRT